jgi:hypothetical protein
VSYPVVLAVPQNDDQIVLTDYMDPPDRGNLARIRNDGTEAWRVTPATHSQDAWTFRTCGGGRVPSIDLVWLGCDARPKATRHRQRFAGPRRCR